MTPADLVAIAARLLSLDTARALALVDLDAAEAALSEADVPGHPVEGQAAGLLVALVRHRPFARANRQVALLATLQFVGERGLDLDLRPARAARDLIDAIDAGTTGQAAVAAWIAARLRPAETRPSPETRRSTDMRRSTGTRRSAEVLPSPERPDMSKKPAQLTERAHQAVAAARSAATSMGHNYVGTEHLLLGLLDAGGIGGQALDRLSLTPYEIRAAIERIVGYGTDACTDDPRFSPRSKKVLDLAQREARRLRCGHVGTEHILLAILREGEGLAAQILHGREGADRAAIVGTVMDLIRAGDAPSRGRRREYILAELEEVFEENERLHGEVDRLRALLRRHGIEPDNGTSRSA
ncbi:Clp protease N-terminal domain-containing protein [Spirillospora sp. NPDC048911]|uniref:Clp protease N-terminal domain-containing protein n=1 Tax=Spirillospora sp. NPDC048911 TaxID=3364527 RepID=UPI00371AF2E1